MDPLEAIGRSFEATEWNQLGLPLYHVSKAVHPDGTLLRGSDSQQRPHFSFFLEEPPDEFIAIPDYAARRTVELTFETARFDHFPTRPSRKQAFFCSASRAGANHWLTKSARNGGYLYECTFISGLATVLDVVWFNYAVRAAKGIIAPSQFAGGSRELREEVTFAAESYWRGDSFQFAGNDPLPEVLIEGEIQLYFRS